MWAPWRHCFSGKKELPRRPETWSVDKPLGRGDSFLPPEKSMFTSLSNGLLTQKHLRNSSSSAFQSWIKSAFPYPLGCDNSLSSGPLPNPRSTSRGSAGWLPCQRRTFTECLLQGRLQDCFCRGREGSKCENTNPGSWECTPSKQMQSTGGNFA